MLKIPNNKLGEFRDRFQTHRLNVAASNVFFTTAVMLNKYKFNYITRDMYQELFLNALSDIELVTSPTDAFVPTGEKETMFVINQLVPEYVEISKRIPYSLLESAFSPASALIVLLKSDPQKIELVHDDIFNWFCLFKYIDQIDMIRLNIFSTFTPVIEYVVDNIGINDWKNFLKTNKINKEKYGKYCEDIIFNPDMKSIDSFYLNGVNEKVPIFNVSNLIERLVTNIDVKDEILLILAAFLVISFAMRDFIRNDDALIENSKCAKYVRDVLSKL